jgi:hypothetical protein
LPVALAVPIPKLPNVKSVIMLARNTQFIVFILIDI